MIFGRRGSGKSCLLMQYLKTADTKRIIPVYVLADEYKRLTYPDTLIRLLIEILEAVPVRWKRLKTICRRPIPTLMHAAALRKMLDMADEQDVVEDHQRKVTEDARAAIKADGIGHAELGSERNTSLGRSSTFRERKIDTLERHLRDYKRAIAETVDAWPRRTGARDPRGGRAGGWTPALHVPLARKGDRRNKLRPVRKASDTAQGDAP